MGLPLYINVSDGQNSQFQPKIGQDATFPPTLNGHNSAIFHLILTIEHTKIISLSRQIEWCKKLSSISFRLAFGFWPIFCSDASHVHMGSIAWSQNHPQVLGKCPGHHHNPQLKILFSKMKDHRGSEIKN